MYSSPTETFDATLNQTNIGHNNNKFYLIQVLQRAGGFYAWCVGAAGAVCGGG